MTDPDPTLEQDIEPFITGYVRLPSGERLDPDQALIRLLSIFESHLNRAVVEGIDKWVAHTLENVYPLNVFPRTTKEDKAKLNGFDDILHTKSHVDGIYHGMHILRREARGLSPREDLERLPQETPEYYAKIKANLQSNTSEEK